ncbi:MAG: hypothetical protein U5L09_09475 [Bacteroidales bacterium]|nr:hypothetical protein [Bacteroidales bacterium]
MVAESILGIFHRYSRVEGCCLRIVHLHIKQIPACPFPAGDTAGLHITQKQLSILLRRKPVFFFHPAAVLFYPHMQATSIGVGLGDDILKGPPSLLIVATLSVLQS